MNNSSSGKMSCHQCHQPGISFEQTIGLEDGPIEQQRDKIFCSRDCFKTYLSTQARADFKYRCGHCLKLRQKSDQAAEWRFCQTDLPLQVYQPCCGRCDLSKRCRWMATVSLKGSVEIDPTIHWYNPTKCQVCPKPGSSKCSKCRIVRYCSIECQHQDWPVHKTNCRVDPELGRLTQLVRAFSKETGCDPPIIYQSNN